MPYTEKPETAGVNYKMKMVPQSDSIKVRIFFDSTLPFKKGGHNVAASFKGGKEKIWNINHDLNWENKYNKMYPTGAARMIESSTVLSIPGNEDGIYDLIIRPLDPGVVIYKIVVDNGGYEPTFLKMQESPYNR